MKTTAQTLSVRGHDIGLGFVYWLSFLIALEPGKVARAIEAGAPLSWEGEVLRILGAATLGALATPAVAALMRRFPIKGDFVQKHLVLHGASAAAIALGLIVASCVLAPVLNVGDTRPFLTALPDHLTANWLLLAFVVGGLTALLHVVPSSSEPQRAQAREPGDVPVAEPAGAYLDQVQIKARGRVSVVDLDTVDWIEAQGNYVALHCGGATHLLRETLSSFETQLDPRAFVRVHRSRLVSVARIAAVTPLCNGDGTIRLTDGTDVRMSRAYREAVHERLADARCSTLGLRQLPARLTEDAASLCACAARPARGP